MEEGWRVVAFDAKFVRIPRKRCGPMAHFNRLLRAKSRTDWTREPPLQTDAVGALRGVWLAFYRGIT
jgi:hypothetical protein